jgi:DNA-binding MarR family transcriptional regulator
VDASRVAVKTAAPANAPDPSQTDEQDAIVEHPAPQPSSPLADGIERLQHVLGRARAQSLDRARGDVEWSRLIAMKALVTHGPLRASALAELVRSDPSTVSRQVAQLVAEGYIERCSDPIDGRASVLIATAKAQRAVDEQRKVRDTHYQQMLAGWSTDDRDRLANLLTRFTDDFETYRDSVAAATLPDDTSPARERTD